MQTGLLPLDPAVFGLAPSAGPVELVQTHIGWVYLTGDYAFKLKKHVKFDFLDFTTLEQRHWACKRELKLNSRLCPQIYLGLRPVYKMADGQCIVGESQITPAGAELIDWAVWMKRLPQDRMLDVLLQQNAVTVADIEFIAALLAPFYVQSRGKIAPCGLGNLDAVTANVDENLREGGELSDDVLAPGALQYIAARAKYFLNRYGELIRQRARQGFVVDGHGDLRAENICLPRNELPVLFDCIEFNDRFRVCDSALDIAFLAMDLDTRGKTELSAALLDSYRRTCDPQLPEKLLSFYLGYRAFVKGKVAAWIARDPHVGAAQKTKALADARLLFDWAAAYASRNEPALIVCCGIAGSGKSTLARALAARLHCAHLATDWLRDEIIPRGIPAEQRYARPISDQVYATLRDKAESLLRQNKTVIADGTFITPERRAPLVALAKQLKLPVLLVLADAGQTDLAARISARVASGDTFGSEADVQVAQQHARDYVPPQASEGFARIIRIDTSRAPEESQWQVWNEVLSALAASI